MRVKGTTTTSRRHKRLLKRSEGFRGRKKNCFRLAKLAVQKSLLHAYKGRKIKKRTFRALWIIRLNAAVRPLGLTYSSFMFGLKKAGITIDRKVLSDLAINDLSSFNLVAEKAKSAIAA